MQKLIPGLHLSVEAEQAAMFILFAHDHIPQERSRYLAKDDAITTKTQREVEVLTLREAADIRQSVLCACEKPCPIKVCFPTDMREQVFESLFQRSYLFRQLPLPFPGAGELVVPASYHDPMILRGS